MHHVFINGGCCFYYPGGSGTCGNGPPAMGLHRVGHNWSDSAAAAAISLHLPSPCTLPPLLCPSNKRWLELLPADDELMLCHFLCSQYNVWALDFLSVVSHTLGGIVFLTKASLPPSQGSAVPGDTYVVLAAAKVLTRSFLLSPYYTAAHVVTVWPSYVCGNNKNKW